MIKGKVKVKTNFNIQDYIKLQGFGNGGQLQKVIDSEVIRLSDPYVPSDTTAIRKSVFLNTDFGSGEVVYSIYGNPNGRNTYEDTTSRFQDAPTRGPFWVHRMLDAGGREKLMLGIKRLLGK